MYALVMHVHVTTCLIENVRKKSDWRQLFNPNSDTLANVTRRQIR